MNPALAACLGGVVPPIATPLTPERRLDVPSLLALRARLLEAGVNGIFTLGSTGEAGYLSAETRAATVEALAGAKGAEALLVGVVATTAARVIDAVAELPTARIDAVVVTGPFYAAAGPQEIARHFELIAASTELPVIAYNIPVNVGYALPMDVMRGLLADRVIAGIKDSATDLTGLRRITEDPRRPADALIFTGSDALLDCGLAVGANGSVAGLSNVAPELFVSAVRAHAAGDVAGVARAQRSITRLTRLYEQIDPACGLNSLHIGAIKSALYLQGVIAGDTLSEPMTPVTPERREFVRQVLAEADVRGGEPRHPDLARAEAG